MKEPHVNIEAALMQKVRAFERPEGFLNRGRRIWGSEQQGCDEIFVIELIELEDDSGLTPLPLSGTFAEKKPYKNI